MMVYLCKSTDEPYFFFVRWNRLSITVRTVPKTDSRRVWVTDLYFFSEFPKYFSNRDGFLLSERLVGGKIGFFSESD